MGSENQVSGRPRSWLLILLAMSVVALLVMWMWPTGAATSGVPASARALPGEPRRQAKASDTLDLDVRLDALGTPRPELGIAERNPFRFRPVAPPPPPPQPVSRNKPVTAATPPPPPPPPTVPPIPLKFIGIVEKQGFKVAALSDCRTTYHGSEGQIIDGRYRLVSIGVESIVLEYVDGRGRTTVRQDGCSPR